MHPTQMIINPREFPVDQVAWAYPVRKAARLMGISLDTLERMHEREVIDIVQERPGAKRMVLHREIVRYLDDLAVATPKKEAGQ